MHYDIDNEQQLMVIKLDKGEWLMESLKEAFAEKGVEHAAIVMGIGMLKLSEIGFYDGTSHRTRTISEPMELVSLMGTLAKVEGEPSIHLHASLASGDGNVVGGHLVDGQIEAIAEIAALVPKALKFTRKDNPVTGLKELAVERDNS